MIERPRAIHLYVSNLDIGREWYSRALEVEPDFEDGETVTFTVRGCQLTLEQTDVTNAPSTKVFWAVDDLGWEYQRISAIGQEDVQATQLVGIHSDRAEILDPFGNVFGLIAATGKNERILRQSRTAQKLALQNVRQTLNDMQQEDVAQKKTNRIIGWCATFAGLLLVVFLWKLVDLQTPAAGSLTTLPIKATGKP